MRTKIIDQNWILDNKLYYANECGFFVGLGQRYLWEKNENAHWYYKMAAHYGRLALEELYTPTNEMFTADWRPEYMNKHYDK